MTIPDAFAEAMETGDIQEFERLMQAYPNHVRTEADRVLWLHHAAAAGQLPFVELFVRLGADVNGSQDTDPEGAVVWAAREGHLDVVRWLLDQGAKINHVVHGRRRCFALVGAVVDGHLDVVKLLVERGRT
jgi:ankyrin repeat protein